MELRTFFHLAGFLTKTKCPSQLFRLADFLKCAEFLGQNAIQDFVHRFCTALPVVVSKKSVHKLRIFGGLICWAPGHSAMLQWWRSGHWARNAVLWAWSGERLEMRQQRYTAEFGASPMIFSLSKRTSFRMCLQSPGFIEVRVHWAGRTLICAGDKSCPACAFNRGKSYWYAAATIEKKLEVVEMCDSLARQLIDFHHTIARSSAEGIVCIGKRPAKRSTWTLEKLEYMPDLVRPVSDRVLIDAIASLYQIPFSPEGETLQQFGTRMKKAHLALLSNCYMFADNALAGSNQR